MAGCGRLADWSTATARPAISNQTTRHARRRAVQNTTTSTVAKLPRTVTEKEKENKKPPPSKGKEKEDSAPSSPIAAASAASDLAELEDKILAALLSNTPDLAGDFLALLLTQNLGEYIFRIGLHPLHVKLFTGELTDDSEGWTEPDIIHKGIQATVEEVGSKTSVPFETQTRHLQLSLLLCLPPPNVSLTPEVRCTVVGNISSGKSTTLGVLTRGALDDGRGRARVGLFRHKHEIETGRTSSVGMKILGFNPNDAPILPNTANSTDPDAAKIVSFIDLTGHEQYLKTTLYSLTSGAPSCVILMVGANAGLIGMSKEHLAIVLALSVPVVVCITKIDMTPPNVLAESIKQVTKILKSPENPVFVKSIETAVEISTAFGKDWLSLQVSNVTGEGLDFPLRECSDLLQFSVTETWSVPYPTVVKSMQFANIASAEAGQCVSVALKWVRKAAARGSQGMVLVHKTDNPPKGFEGQVLILYHNTTLQKNYQAMLHGGVRACILICCPSNCSNHLEFISHPEFINEGMKLNRK
ncbi:GTP-binding protein 1 [Mycena olivaceomarginata]|nr:GTP-binding protein 1 [Mycena olivaceomarginata]